MVADPMVPGRAPALLLGILSKRAHPAPRESRSNAMNSNHLIARFAAVAIIVTSSIFASAALAEDKMKSETATGDHMKSDAMKGDHMKGDHMKGDAMKGDHMKGDAMKSDAMSGDKSK
jgi:pentapeptide MXKDX repeat protein